MKLYTVAQYAKRIGKTRIWVHQLMREKKVVAFKCGDIWLVIKGENNLIK